MTPVTEIYINQTFGERRIGFFEGDDLVEIHIERQSQLSVVGNIYKGKVLRVLPGMQAAFIDIGLSRSAFLHVKDVRNQALESVSSNNSSKIENLLAEGQMIWVQVNRDPIGDKGARLTTELSLPSDKLVYFPDDEQIAISNKIKDQADRHELKELITSYLKENRLSGGFVIRTIASESGAQAIIDTAKSLTQAWQNVRHTLINSAEVVCAYQQSSLLISLLREFSDKSNLMIQFDQPHALDEIGALVSKHYPDLADNIELLNEDRSKVFADSLENGINRALQQVVELPSGGALNIHSTEALVSIDVNTGANIGSSSSDSFELQNNIEAAVEIARQLRLRNLGGIIIIDFVDMPRPSERERVVAVIKAELAKDRTHSTASEISQLGLVELKRHRSRKSLAEALCQPCDVCQGTGIQKSAETLCYQILREIIDHSRHSQAKAYTILATESVIAGLKSDIVAKALESLRQATQSLIHFKQVDFLAHYEYEIALD